jgi:hypothetical protein
MERPLYEGDMQIVWDDMIGVLPPTNKLNAVFLEYRPFARKEARRYRAVVQFAKPHYGFIDGYGFTPVQALSVLTDKLDKLGVVHD